MRLLPILLFSAAACLHAEVKVSVGDIQDRRSTGQFFNSLEVELKVSGPELAECKGLRVVLKDAADDTGKALEAKKSGFDDKGFRPPEKPFGGLGRDKQKADEYEVKLEFANPARAAKTIKAINGALELLMPAKDPASIITANVAKEAGKPLAHDALKAAGIELTLTAPKNSDIGYTIADPNSKVAAVEFGSADGKPLKTQGTMSSKFGSGPKSIRISLENPAAPDVVAKIYLITEKSVLSVPIALTGVPLP
jgi:hypothetical protein